MNGLLSTPFSYFTDPVLRAPTIGCMLMCFAAALVGVIIFLRKQSLLGECLSHASYPGVIIGVICAGLLSLHEDSQVAISLLIMAGAFTTALLGLWAIYFLEKKLKIRSDSALCFVLSSFFGIGLTLASQVQFSFTPFYRQVQVYLYGQAATMTDLNIWVYGCLSLIIFMTIILFYKELKVMTFDRQFAKSLGIPVNLIDNIVFVLTVLAVIIGIRSVGVVLMSAMLIAPPAAARQYTNRFSAILILSAIFGLICGYLGNYLSGEATHYLSFKYPETRLSLPTGPMIVMVASSICLFSLLFAPENGMLLRLFRMGTFRYRCMCENLLKAMWRLSSGGDQIRLDDISKHQNLSLLYLHFLLWRLAKNGWVEGLGAGTYRLTHDGLLWAAKIVRLHRLWELYLVDYLGVGAERVHRSAEEMEHIITPELERELTLLLNDPKRDPHHQLIPPQEIV